MPEWSLAALRNLLPQMSGANFGTTSPQEDADMPLTGLDRAVKYALPFSAPPPSPQDQTVAYRTPYGNITEGDIGRATDVAMATSGGGLSTKGIKAFHSSPHDFDRFDLSKIGTGEGAQVYGHGLYFAENPAVSGQGGQYWDQFVSRFGGPESTAAKELQFHGFDRAKAAENMRSRIMYPDEALPDDVLKRQLALRQEALKLLEGDKPVGPRTYEVNINADPAHFLDWDKSLREQQNIADIIRANPRSMDEMKGPIKRKAEAVYGGDIPADITGSDAYTLMRGYREPARASAALNEAGIPGIKYLDQGSRVGPITGQKISQIEGSLQQARADLAGGFGDPERMARKIANLEHELSLHKPSSNYVVFDPKIIDIMKKYGLAGLAPAGAAAYGAAQQDQQQF